ncbi:7624_t:CDS:1, partial [Racocetra persica]
ANNYISVRNNQVNYKEPARDQGPDLLHLVLLKIATAFKEATVEVAATFRLLA